MNEMEQSIVQRVVDNLVREFPVERIFLFGSRARGDTDEDSDYDFLIVMKTEIKPSRRGIIVRQKGLIPGVPMDFMVRTPEEWSQGFPLKKEIIAEGEVVFERRDASMAYEGA